MDLTERVRQWVQSTCQQVIDDDHPLQVDTVGGQEHRVFEGHCLPEDIGLRIGAPCSHGTDRHGTTHVATVFGLEKPHPEAVTGVGLAAAMSATAGEGGEHAEPRP